MITLTLQRNKPSGKAVTGTLAFDLLNKEGAPEHLSFPTLENAEFIIPAGTYPLDRTWSPKFKKFLPEVQEVFAPDGTPRLGIRIHRGAIPEHSTGCILLDMTGMANLDVFFNQLELYYEDENAQLTITDGSEA